jgi:hypothetical protein
MKLKLNTVMPSISVSNCTTLQKSVGDPILEMRTDYTIPDYHSRSFNVIIDLDYWKNRNPVFSEDALIWFNDGSRADSGTGLGFLALEQTDAYASLWINVPQFFKLKYMPSYNVHMKL